MLNIICVKWGDKYNAYHVNRLYKMVEKNLNIPFEFYCYTDDASDIVPWINILSIEEEYDDVWNKLALFNFDLGKTLYFDLDVIIQNNVEPLMQKSFTLVQCYWKPLSELKWPDHNINSSVMYWEGLENQHIYNDFKLNADTNMIKYYGIDHFIFHNRYQVSHWNQGLIYSHGYGIDSNHWFKPDPQPYYKEDAIVCLLNGEFKEFQYPQSSSPTSLYQEQ
jgi:hypothetical protein